mgnify:CR=1 FL=1
MSDQRLKIVTVASELVPLAKTGGLADVTGALTRIFNQVGHGSLAVLPAYQSIAPLSRLERTGLELEITVGRGLERVEILLSHDIPGVPVYLVDHPCFSGRPGLYGTPEGDYPDNGLRFILFARAALELIDRLEVVPDIIHCHDWQTGLVPVYLRHLYQSRPSLNSAKVVFTIHNLAFQGLFPPEEMLTAGLPWSLFNIDGLEFYGKMNFLKGGMAGADHITTVSPTYAREILTPEFGCGLHGFLNVLKEKLTGIINGIDYAQWNPQSDSFIPARYGPGNLGNKLVAKRIIGKRFSLEKADERPLLGLVTRLSAQKGLDILIEALPQLLEMDVNLVLLGTGDVGYHRKFEELRQIHKGRLGVLLAFDDPAAHLIYAGSDIFLMPSRYEPCGLGQLIAMRYGAIPVVRQTGGLADTVRDYKDNSPDTNGFTFPDFTPSALVSTVARALSLYDQKSLWNALVSRAMISDFSWESSARQYLELFQRIV